MDLAVLNSNGIERLNLADTVPVTHLSIALIRSKLTAKELRWFDLDLAYYGEQYVLRNWHYYEMRLNYVRQL
jgi:hypothetical protein